MMDEHDPQQTRTAAQVAQELRRRIAAEHENQPHPEMNARELKAHLLVHELVEQQLLAGDPPEIVQALDRMLSAGLDRHQAIHAVGTVVAREALAMMKQHRQLNKKNYLNALRSLSVEGYLKTIGKRE